MLSRDSFPRDLATAMPSSHHLFPANLGKHFRAGGELTCK
ncbi:hypothetical protein HMPREF1862_01123 [Varibaculum cambriense]|uniref:Uncharacterized protein n=1 Tax=Varibaculum cambriense TaxID=184870 RepID=A0AB34X0P2_9ACTO|nr:hypothetical protein HMPREF1862_01123 [Varibaculum cambriense]